MNKDTVKGLLILGCVVLALGLFALMATDNGVGKIGCIFRAAAHGVALTNIHAVCGL